MEDENKRNKERMVQIFDLENGEELLKVKQAILIINLRCTCYD
jgi:hypothetical protein